ncbi:MAG: tRNA (mnm(5)s(2)U34)-methyltransferase [Cellulosilyticaceae bacterium]
MFKREMTQNAQWFIKDHLASHSRSHLVAMDGTLGKGADMAFLCGLEQVAEVWGFDIQQEAIAMSKEHVGEWDDKDVHYVRDSHHHVDQYIQKPIDIAMFNLGYLPTGDKAIVTHSETTLVAIEKVMGQLAEGGIMTILTYPGHEEGMNEHCQITQFLGQITQKRYEIFRISKQNVKRPCPEIFVILG